MEKLLILENFAVDVPQGVHEDGPHVGKDKPPITRRYLKGVVVDASEVPEGQTAADWIEKGLARAA
jgi:hypothetical protein